MIIYKDLFTEDEMFTDIYQMEEVEDGLLYKVTGKLVTESDKFDDALIGANASAEEQSEEVDTNSRSGINIVLSNRLVEFPQTKKSYQSHLKDYMKSLAAKLDDEAKDKFKAKAQSFVAKKLLPKFKDLQFYCESMKPDGMLAIVEWEGDIPYMYFFKDGILPEKVIGEGWPDFAVFAPLASNYRIQEPAGIFS
ncbi:hypothetical protein LSH36_271g07023 [Paralvinella palmiformis]|uniref:TCTP domain-containing protein n=1 Tax=Paralvinella palmiformis TaxID=53620 RepID=A0AAD9JJV1_9ANNE|nr:hypothetical protein LSH36_271g07023 [Paralvinella palmiformis]